MGWAKPRAWLAVCATSEPVLNGQLARPGGSRPETPFASRKLEPEAHGPRDGSGGGGVGCGAPGWVWPGGLRLLSCSAPRWDSGLGSLQEAWLPPGSRRVPHWLLFPAGSAVPSERPRSVRPELRRGSRPTTPARRGPQPGSSLSALRAGVRIRTEYKLGAKTRNSDAPSSPDLSGPRSCLPRDALGGLLRARHSPRSLPGPRRRAPDWAAAGHPSSQAQRLGPDLGSQAGFSEASAPRPLADLPPRCVR